MQLHLLWIALLSSSIGSAQPQGPPSLQGALDEFGFTEHGIDGEGETTTYYLKKYDQKPRDLVVYIQGTDANPIFSYSSSGGNPRYRRWFGDEYESLDANTTYAIIPKPGMEGLYREGEIEVPQSYYENNHLEYRLRQVDRSIRDIVQNHLAPSGRVIVYGHSEGAAIAAALPRVNDKVTHLGFWSGNVLNNFYEFSLFNRIEALRGDLSDEEAHQNILGILEWYRSVLKAPESTELDHFGFTNKRWVSYERAPLDDLLQVQIPIYALFATEDESTPIETAYLLPIKFLEYRKDNLTFEVCMGADHSYRRDTRAGKQSFWKEEFLKFMEWAQETTQPESLPQPASLPEVMDRTREAGALLVAAHRGGPAPGFPENALETMQHAFEAGIRVFEIDVAESQDGVLYLMHDRSLRRTAGHDGEVADTDWEVVRGLQLRDPQGTSTDFHPPSLADVLAWAVGTGSILELDRKSTTSFRNIIAAVRAAGADEQVLMITYSDDEAVQVARLAPDLMMTASVRDAEQRARLEQAGVDMRHIVAWLGTREPDMARMAELDALGIEAAFGTLGRPGRRLDDTYTADGDASEYQALVDAGLTLLATDRPYFVVRELTADDRALEILETR